MNDMATLTAFLGWCSVINIGILVFSAILISIVKESVAKIHGAMFGIDQHHLPSIYLQILGNYKMAVFVFNIVPYFALKIMG